MSLASNMNVMYIYILYIYIHQPAGNTTFPLLKKTPLAPAVALPVHSILTLGAMLVFRVLSIHLVCSCLFKGCICLGKYVSDRYRLRSTNLLLMLKVRKLYKLLGFDEDEKEVSSTDDTLQKPSLGKPWKLWRTHIYVIHVLQNQEKPAHFLLVVWRWWWVHDQNPGTDVWIPAFTSCECRIKTLHPI